MSSESSWQSQAIEIVHQRRDDSRLMCQDQQSAISFPPAISRVTARMRAPVSRDGNAEASTSTASHGRAMRSQSSENTTMSEWVGIQRPDEDRRHWDSVWTPSIRTASAVPTRPTPDPEGSPRRPTRLISPTATALLARYPIHSTTSTSATPRSSSGHRPLIPPQLHSMVSGAGAGLVASVVTCPLDVLKTALQASRVHSGAAEYEGVQKTAARIWRQSGVRGFYRGLGPTLAGYLPTWGIYFTVYDLVKDRLGTWAQDPGESLLTFACRLHRVGRRVRGRWQKE